MFDLGDFLEYLKENRNKGASQQSIGDALGISQAYAS